MESHKHGGVSIAVKMIAISTILLLVVIGLFGILSRMQVRRLIEDSSARLEQRTIQNLRRSGVGQLKLLGQTARIAMARSDNRSVQAAVQQIADQDDMITEVAVVDRGVNIIAHSDPEKVRKPADGRLARAASAKKLEVFDGESSIAFAMPVLDKGERVCSVLLAYDLTPLKAGAATLQKRELSTSLVNVVIVGLLSLLLGVFLTIIQSLQITRPIKALADKASQIAGGDFGARVTVSSGDEIGQLGDRFNYMADQVGALMQEAMAKVVMEKELEVVSAVQATLVPDDSVVQLGSLKIAGYFRPATQCGGDWWNYYRLANGKVLVIIGDVTGHGAASAMITAAAKGAATTMTDVSEGKLELPILLRAMNTAINDSAKGRFVMTCFASIWDEKTRVLTYANAGHNFPYLYDGSKLTPLVARGNRLGDVVGSRFEIRETEVPENAMVVWYTDGIVEGQNADGEEYGERRFRKRIKEYSELEPDNARDQLVERANEFFGEVPPADDITLIVGRFS